jgi:uracil-DNA glycosylase
MYETGIPWNDPSGDRLRHWLGLTPEQFYDPRKVAINPMSFCYPAKPSPAIIRPVWNARRAGMKS